MICKVYLFKLRRILILFVFYGSLTICLDQLVCDALCSCFAVDCFYHVIEQAFLNYICLTFIQLVSYLDLNLGFFPTQIPIWAARILINYLLICPLNLFLIILVIVVSISALLCLLLSITLRCLSQYLVSVRQFITCFFNVLESCSSFSIYLGSIFDCFMFSIINLIFLVTLLCKSYYEFIQFVNKNVSKYLEYFHSLINLD